MKKFWFRLSKWDKNLASLAIESGFKTFYVSKEDVEKIKELAIVETISNTEKADFVLGKDVQEVFLKTQEDEDQVVKFKGQFPTIIHNAEWTIIPLENLISKTTNLIQYTTNYDEAKLALETMEKGADGVLVETTDYNEIKKLGDLIRQSENEKLKLVEAIITKLPQLEWVTEL